MTDAPPTTFSVITPVFETPVDVLAATIDSVRAQDHPHWELCLVDDGSTNPKVHRALARAARRDPRVRVQMRGEQGGIVAASNDALAMATGDFVVLLDHDDLLLPRALSSLASAIASIPQVDYLYSDEDKVDADGLHSGAFLKPSWSPERFRTQMYTCHLSAMRRALVEEVGGFDPSFEGSQDWDLILRVTERARRVVHIPRILYSWRTLATSTASASAAKPYAYDAGTRALQAHCDRTGFAATVERDEAPERSGVYHLEPALSDTPKVSIIVPSGGGTREVRGRETTLVSHCLGSIKAHSTYPDFEIIVVLDDHVPRALADELESLAPDRVRIVMFDRPFSFSEKINVGALHATGDHLLLLNDDTEVSTPNWIERLVMYSQHPGIGAVGARLLYEDRRLQHVGLASQDSCVGHIYHGFAPGTQGYANNVLVAANYLAVTGACLMTPRAVFEEVGGLSPQFPLNYNDVDYCLKVWRSGRRVAYDPDTVLFHFESASRETAVSDAELRLLRDRWDYEISQDRFYPRNLNPKSVNFVPPLQLRTGELLGASSAGVNGP
ncbi:MAG: glycosyltransferase family 2 protein [Microthrixaceae bacterium]